jgi:methyltransferase (TIGR00027 family)
LKHYPFAAALAGDEAERLLTEWQELASSQGIPLEAVVVKQTRYVAIRTRFIDDLIRHAVEQLGCQQVVILGSGLDTRAFRLTYLSDIHFYEIDRSELLNYKMSLLQNNTPSCIHHLVPGDLTDLLLEWITLMLDAGYQPHIPTVWIAEGVSMYLQEVEVNTLLQTISQWSCIKSVVGLDCVTLGSVAAADRARRANTGRVMRHWQFGHDDPKQLLADHGWDACVKRPQEIAGGYGRYPQSLPIDSKLGQVAAGRGVWLIQAHLNPSSCEAL